MNDNAIVFLTINVNYLCILEFEHFNLRFNRLKFTSFCAYPFNPMTLFSKTSSAKSVKREDENVLIENIQLTIVIKMIWKAYLAVSVLQFQLRFQDSFETFLPSILNAS